MLNTVRPFQTHVGIRFQCGFVHCGFGIQGRREDLVGGGLIRSLGGAGRVLLARLNKEKQLYDQRILGDGDFVEEIIRE